MKHLIKIFDQAFSHEEYCGSKVGKNYSNKIIWDRSDDIKDGDIVFLQIHYFLMSNLFQQIV